MKKNTFYSIMIIVTIVITITFSLIFKLMTLGLFTVLFTFIPIIPLQFIFYIIYSINYLFDENKNIRSTRLFIICSLSLLLNYFCFCDLFGENVTKINPLFSHEFSNILSFVFLIINIISLISLKKEINKGNTIEGNN